jgi:LuxR family transcriptional regulator, maltose regulon positive regulatory protein
MGYFVEGYNKERLLEKDMLNALLQTKLYVPRPKPRLVSRPRLLGKLDDLRERKLALISAPAGFGKTTLLSEWIEHQDQEQLPLQVTWLSLDSNDNDPARFLTYLIAALQKVDASFGEEVLPVLQAFQIASIKEIWEILASQIVSDSCQIVLVLDDYHVIEAPIIHEGISFMLERMPACMHLVISTRADPPLSLSRLRVRGELVELRVSDLRFSSEEIADFLDLSIGKKLSTTDQVELKARTEGWIAGLQLAALAMQSLAEQAPDDEASLSAFVHRLSGSTRFIMDYLVEEVLQRLPEDSRSFLLQTSILERLTAPLCNAVTDRHDSQSVLDALEKTNLFLFPLDDERGWYRYHHLFADLLRGFLQHAQSSRIPKLHAKASAWYEGQGLVTEAIQHALKVPDPDEAARLMEKVALEMLLRGEVITIKNWSTWIRDEQVRQRPLLCVYFVWAFLVSEKVELAEHYLSLISQDQIDSSPSTQHLQSHVIVAHSVLAFYRGDYENAIQFKRRAVEQQPPEQTHLRGVLAYSSGAAYEMIGEDEAAFQSLQEAKQISHVFGNRAAELSALKKLGDLQARRGQLHQAALSYRQSLQIGSIRDDQLLPVAAQPVYALGQLLYEWNQLEEAERYLLEGVELSRKLESTFYLLSNLQVLARVHWIQGDRESALRMRREAEQIMLEFPPHPSVAARAAVQQMRMYLRMGEVQTAVRWAQSYGQNWKSGHAYPVELMTILWIRVWIAQENASEAVKTLEQALPLARAAGRWGVVIELLVLQALALAMERQIPPALAALEEALRLAQPEEYTRIFLDEGEPMARLLRMAYRSKGKGSREYETKLLEGLLSVEASALPVSAEISSGKSPDHPVLIDPLTERELDVLRMIAEGHSNQEIAEKLVITMGTVKAHLSHIYTKLDVRSRTQAIIKANELHLLKP